MKLAYLCRLRRAEILSATRSQILEDGFDMKQTKGSSNAITLWSHRLIDAVNYDAGEVKSFFIACDKPKNNGIGICIGVDTAEDENGKGGNWII